MTEEEVGHLMSLLSLGGSITIDLGLSAPFELRGGVDGDEISAAFTDTAEDSRPTYQPSSITSFLKHQAQSNVSIGPRVVRPKRRPLI